MRSKQCTKCGRLLPLHDFYTQPKGKWGHRASCKTCCNAVTAARRLTQPPEPYAQYKERYGEQNKRLQKARQRALRALAARHPDEFEHLLIVERALLEPTKEET